VFTLIAVWALIAHAYGLAFFFVLKRSKPTEPPPRAKQVRIAEKPTPAPTAAPAAVAKAVAPRPAAEEPASAASAASGNSRSVIAFDGKQGGIIVKYSPVFDLRTLTAEAWIWVDDPPMGAIITRDNPKIGPWQFLFTDDGKLRSDVAWGNWCDTPRESFCPIPRKTWLHVAMVYDGGEVRNYVNGRRVASYRADVALAINDDDVRVGRDPYRNKTFNGRIAGVRLSNAPLYNKDFTPEIPLPRLPSTVMLLPLDRGEGTVAEDASGNRCDGVIQNGTWTTVSLEEMRINPALTPAPTPALARPPQGRILLDMSHQYGFTPVNGLCGDTGYLRPEGYVVAETEAGLREEVLKAFDVLVLYQNGGDSQYTQKEAGLVKNFLERGGGVLFLADAGSSPNGLSLNAIAKGFGFEFLPTKAQGPFSARAGFGALESFNPRLLRVETGVKCTPIYQDSMGRPVAATLSWKSGRIAAVSGSELLTNPAGSRKLANLKTVHQVFQWLSSTQIGDRSFAAAGGRIDPDRVIEAGSFRILCPDPLPEERFNFLSKEAPIIYSKVSELFGYDTPNKRRSSP